VHTGDHLKVTAKEHDALVPKSTEEIFPEYYLIRVNDFDKVAVTPLDEWISYLKTGDIPADATAPGLPEAREKMRYYDMSPQEQRAYQKHLVDLAILNDLADEIAGAKERADKAEKQAKEEKKRAVQAEKQAKEEKKRAVQAEKQAKEEKKKAEEEKQLRYTYILRMKQQGYSIETLMDITGLSREEIERL
jgi:hypothetical protein